MPTSINDITVSWYVLHTKSRFENVVHDGLIKRSIDVFLPKIKVKSKRRDRNLMIHVPLFPGYMFVRTQLTPDHHLEILKTGGVVRLIGNTEGPLPVPSETVASLKIMVSTDNPVSTGHRLKKGDHVMVVGGPFSGIKGTFCRYKGLGRVVVNIEALGQYAGVDVDEKDVEIIPQFLA